MAQESVSLYLWIALGGAIGSVARFAVGNWAASQWGDSFPWGTLIVNVAGSFVIGFVAVATSADGKWPSSTAPRHFVMTGVLGGFTTFSSFSLQTLQLAERGQWGRFVGNVSGSVVLSLVAVWLGCVTAQLLRAKS